ncbi:hypothetical protein [Nonomuraea pusilla]|uniref:META domain-containing protein n=1 Tax=Nonomuraea pusilla TaxID=46177 RepID=A0A1H7GMZ5_9ACTN|nr:hypothetical protein [Nonomuraea pusilla]SEK38917.1 hypothetical protein SAMN05660976_00426 [Nonomuraea pusilla]
MRTLICAAAALALSCVTVPAQAASGPAATRVAYGYAWADGAGALRITPREPKLVRERRGPAFYRLSAVPGAKELRLGYRSASYRRVTVACGLKETEGRVAVDGKGLGRTSCGPGDLTAALEQGGVPLRVEYRGGEAVRINEFLAEPGASRVARGLLKRLDDATVLFTAGGTTVKLGYTYATGFHRATARCGDAWLAGEPVNADRQGLGTRPCQARHLTKALRTVGHPVAVKIDYVPDSGALNEVWEVFGDA